MNDDDGNVPESSDALTSFTSGRACRFHQPCWCRVENALFTGTSTKQSFDVSSIVTRLYDDRLELHVRPVIGSGAPAVDARMASTLFLKCATNPAGVMHVVCVAGEDIKPDSVFHSALESPALSNTRLLQNDRCLLPSS